MSPQLLYLSYGEKQAITFKYNSIILLKKFNDGFFEDKFKIKINNYINEWKNTKEQHNTMLDFKINMNCDKDTLEKLLDDFGTNF